MYIHEILARKGFHEKFFQVKHFERAVVSGSIRGWISPPDDTIDNLIRFEEELQFCAFHEAESQLY